MKMILHKNDSINLLASLYLSALIIAFLAIIFYYMPDFFIPKKDFVNVYSVFLAKYIPYVVPKTNENFAFFLTLLCTPLIAYASILITQAFIKRFKSRTIKILEVCLVLITAFILMFLFYNSDYFIYLTYNIFHNKIIIFSLIIISALSALSFNRFNIPSYSKKFFLRLLILLSIVLIIFQTISFRIVNVNHAEPYISWGVDFCAAFYSVTQVFAGKTILSDLTAQYGMYAEILKPIFKLIGLSVYKFTFVMGVLQMLALTCILIVQWKLQSSKRIFFLYLLNLCLCTGYVWYFIMGQWDPYYQYYPIRFFFPAVAILLEYYFIKKPNAKFIPIIAVWSALSLIWNLESGIAIFGAFFCYITSFFLFPTILINRKKAALYLSYFLSATLCALFIFVLYLKAKSNHAVDLLDFLKYSHLFYQSGFMMIPLPIKPDPWQAICGIYLFGLIASLYYWKTRRRNHYWDMIFFISILGLGLFIYYQGRAFFTTLILASWPAIFILFLLCGLLFRLIKVNLLPKYYVLLCAIILFFAFTTAVEFIMGVPSLYHSTITTFRINAHPRNTELSRNIDFIKKNAPAKNILIFAPNHAIYYGELGWSSPIKGSGMNEIILKSDLESFKAQIRKQKYFFYQPTNVIWFTHDLGNVFDQFYVAKKSKDNMFLYVKK